MAFFSCYKVVIMSLVVFIGSSSAQLSKDFYDKSCQSLQSIVHGVVQAELKNDPRMGASLLRLHFHDCFVNGCDGSVLLDGPTGEKGAAPNKNSLRGFDVIDRIKSNVVKGCPKAHVSCADILALVARESVVQLGGPGWNVSLGRKDSKTASQQAAQQNLPSPTSNFTQLIQRFNKFGFTTTELVALSGAHTMGEAKCINFRSRLYNESNIDATFAGNLKAICSKFPRDDNNLAFLDYNTSTKFDNNYYKNLVVNKGLLHSDQQLYFIGNPHTKPMVLTYQKDQKAFFNDFAKAMVKMSSLSPHPNTTGEIRVNCRKTNN